MDHWRCGLIGALQYWADGSEADAVQLIFSLVKELKLEVPSLPTAIAIAVTPSHRHTAFPTWQGPEP